MESTEGVRKIATILIVEPNRNQRLLLEEELQYEGYRTLSAATAREALARLTKERADLVLLDIHLPGMDGLELIGRLIEIDSRIPVVIYTGDSSFQENFRAWVADAYVLKSSKLEELVETIRQILARRRRPAEAPGFRLRKERDFAPLA